MTTRYDVYGIGNALVDLEYRVEDDFLRQHGIAKGMMTLAEAEAQTRLLASLEQSHPRMKQASGGSAANSVIAAAAFGASTYYSCKVASDALGDFYRADLIAAGVDTNLAERRPDGVSGTCVVMVTPDGERTMNTFLGITADVSQAELDLEALAASRWLYIEGVALGGAQAHYGVRPDLTTLGKIIGGGMPVGAFGGRREIMDCIAPLGPVYQAGTLSGNPIAMRAGLKTLQLISQPGFHAQLSARTQALCEGLEAAGRAAGVALSTRHVGGMFGVFFSAQAPSSYAEATACDVEHFKRFFHAMLDEGIYLAPSAFEAGFVSIAHTQADIDSTVAAAERALRATRQG